MHDPTADALNCRIEDCRPASIDHPGQRPPSDGSCLKAGRRLESKPQAGLAAMLQLDPENPQVTVEGENIGAKLVSGDEDL